MPIIALQRRIREVGRIRMGDQGTTSEGKRYPRKATHFRLSSPDPTVIDAAADIYGGQAQAWDNNGSRHFEVYTEADQLRIALPPDPRDLGFSQWYELWGNKLCTRRCDGEREQINDQACVCDPEDRECKPTTRLSMFLPDIPGLGVWRLETHGYYAAVELAGALEIIEAIAGAHSIIPARLRLDQREQRKLVNGKPETRKFAVPVIDLDVSIMAVRSLTASGGQVALPEADDPEPSAEGWQPISHTPNEAPVALSLESQLKEIETPKKRAPRKNAAEPLKPTGRAPRKAAEVPKQTCDLCDKPYGADPLTRNPVQLEGCSKYVHKRCLDDQDPNPDPGDGGSTSSDGPRATAEPPPVTGRIIGETMSVGQHNKIMAMTAKAFPVATGTPSDVVRTIRREATLGLCTALGMPEMTSRSDLNSKQANLLIDALTKIEEGALTYDQNTGLLAERSTTEETT
jgi:hypothetical protein